MTQDNNLGKLSKTEERRLQTLLLYMRKQPRGILLATIDELSKVYVPVTADRRAKAS
jgi:hypothetical protein